MDPRIWKLDGYLDTYGALFSLLRIKNSDSRTSLQKSYEKAISITPSGEEELSKAQISRLERIQNHFDYYAGASDKFRLSGGAEDLEDICYRTIGLIEGELKEDYSDWTKVYLKGRQNIIHELSKYLSKKTNPVFPEVVIFVHKTLKFLDGIKQKEYQPEAYRQMMETGFLKEFYWECFEETKAEKRKVRIRDLV